MASIGIIGMQIMGAGFGLLMLYLIHMRYKRKDISSKAYNFLSLFFVGFLILTFIPWIFDPILRTLSFDRRLDFFICAGFIFVISMVMYSFFKMSELNSKMETLIKNVAEMEGDKQWDGLEKNQTDQESKKKAFSGCNIKNYKANHYDKVWNAHFYFDNVPTNGHLKLKWI